jgi:hypothetical protein
MKTVIKISLGFIVLLLLAEIVYFLRNQPTEPTAKQKNMGKTYQAGQYQI